MIETNLFHLTDTRFFLRHFLIFSGHRPCIREFSNRQSRHQHIRAIWLRRSPFQLILGFRAATHQKRCAHLAILCTMCRFDAARARLGASLGPPGKSFWISVFSAQRFRNFRVWNRLKDHGERPSECAAAPKHVAVNRPVMPCACTGNSFGLSAITLFLDTHWAPSFWRRNLEFKHRSILPVAHLIPVHCYTIIHTDNQRAMRKGEKERERKITPLETGPRVQSPKQ